jgi:hypothetical protein
MSIECLCQQKPKISNTKFYKQYYILFFNYDLIMI